jgi:beta-1,2-mannobiose phosphorylase / 1,2-beta-oligomannan phosphorylase
MLKVGAGPPPIKTKHGWLLIYHGVDNDHVYRAGAALLDLKDPGKVLGRTTQPILEPKEPYEKNGDVNNVVFPTGASVRDAKLFVYYGAADKVCCVATADLENLVDHVLKD